MFGRKKVQSAEAISYEGRWRVRFPSVLMNVEVILRTNVAIVALIAIVAIIEALKLGPSLNY